MVIRNFEVYCTGKVNYVTLKVQESALLQDCEKKHQSTLIELKLAKEVRQLKEKCRQKPKDIFKFTDKKNGSL
jgi:hypothetical protein